jgi:hypothetical protein
LPPVRKNVVGSNEGEREGAAVNTRTDKPYGELGKLMDSMARAHDVRGPYNIAQRVTAATGYKVTGQAVSRYFYGDSWPRPGFVSAFADAIGLTRDERDTLAWLYTYGPNPNNGGP